MICERCGKELADSAVICPSCGTVTRSGGTSVPPRPGGYTQYPGSEYSDPHDQPMPTYEQGYAPRQNFTAPPPPNYRPPRQNSGYEQSYNVPPMYPPGAINVTVVNNFAAPAQKNSGALLAEIILSLFGIYGIGWLIAGETTIGVILLICSFVIFWPLAIMFAVFTLGLGIFVCDLPLAIGGIILNAVLLNNRLNRKAQPPIYTTVQAQRFQVPPRQMPPQ